jgi:hypothetical protein
MIKFKNHFLYITLAALMATQGLCASQTPQLTPAPGSSVILDQHEQDKTWNETIETCTPFNKDVGELISDYVGYNYRWERVEWYILPKFQRVAPFGRPIVVNDDIVAFPSVRSVTLLNITSGEYRNVPIDDVYEISVIAPFSPEELIIITTDGVVRTLNTITYQLQQYFKFPYIIDDIVAISDDYCALLAMGTRKNWLSYNSKQLTTFQNLQRTSRDNFYLGEFNRVWIWNKKTNTIVDTLKPFADTRFSACLSVKGKLILGSTNGWLTEYDSSTRMTTPFVSIERLTGRRGRSYQIIQIASLSDELAAVLENTSPSSIHIYNLKNRTITTSFEVQSICRKTPPRTIIPWWHHKRILADYDEEQAVETFNASGKFMDPERIPGNDYVVKLKGNRLLTVNDGTASYKSPDQIIRIYTQERDWEHEASCEQRAATHFQQPSRVNNTMNHVLPPFNNPHTHTLFILKLPHMSHVLVAGSIGLGLLSAYRWYRNASPREVIATASGAVAAGLAALKLYRSR